MPQIPPRRLSPALFSVGMAAHPYTGGPLLADDLLDLLDRPLEVVVDHLMVVLVGVRHLLRSHPLALFHHLLRLGVTLLSTLLELFQRRRHDEDENAVRPLPAHLFGALDVDLEDDVVALALGL